LPLLRAGVLSKRDARAELMYVSGVLPKLTGLVGENRGVQRYSSGFGEQLPDDLFRGSVLPSPK
jgi:hypothetical protein